MRGFISSYEAAHMRMGQWFERRTTLRYMQLISKHNGWASKPVLKSLCFMILGAFLSLVICSAGEEKTQHKDLWFEPAEPNHQTTRVSRSIRRREPSQPDTPEEEPSEEVKKLARAEKLRRRRVFRETLRIRPVRGPGYIDLFAENLTAHSVTITLDLTPKNLKPTQDFPQTIVLAAREDKQVAHLVPIDDARPYRYRYHVDMLPGKAKAVPDQDHAYALPYRPGTAYWVVQGYGGRFTHQGRSRYSVDFAMPEGTPIYAARAGIVAEIKADSDENGTSEEHRDLANYVVIEHTDGTWAEYYHLKVDGVQVKVDESVAAGELIGYSGNTGYSKIPHLHFAVRKTISGKVSSTIPVKFKTSQGVVNRLQPKRRYRAVQPSAE